MTVMAQTPYMNENYMPTDLIGSARYVGMGGALGALGADISAGSANPAALGLYRRSDAALSFSVLTQGEKPDLNADMTHMSFDQIGFVVSVPIMGKTVIGEGNLIGPNTYIEDSVIGSENEVLASWLTDTVIRDHNHIGPYFHARNGTVIASGTALGNFVEFKNATVADGAKAHHLSYIGDASIGKDANIGCGVITANYDGTKKHRTEIGEGAFVGCDSVLVAPVAIGKDALVAAGSVVTDDVPEGATAFARSKQTNKPGTAKKLLKRE